MAISDERQGQGAGEFGPAELIRHGETGLLTGVGDEAQLAAAIEQALDHRVDLRQMGARAQADVRRRFAPSSIQPLYEALFRDVAERPGVFPAVNTSPR